MDVATIIVIYSIYSVIHLIVFLFPQWFFRNIKNTRDEINGDNKFLNIAHRLGCADGLEDTLPAAQTASITNGANMLDMDICYTKDKVIVISHDLDLVRTCGDSSNVSSYNYADLPTFGSSIDVPYALDSNGDFQIYTRQVSDSTKLTTLSDLLDWLNTYDTNKDIWIQMELKEVNEDLVTDVKTLLNAKNRSDRAIWGCAKSTLNDKFSSVGPDIPRFASATEIVKLYLLYWFNMVGFYKPDFSVLVIPYLSEAYIKSEKAYYQSKGLGSWIIVYPYLFLIWLMKITSRPLFKHLHKKGIHIMLYGLSTEDDFKDGIDRYYPFIDGYNTDTCALLKSFMDNNQTLIDKLYERPFLGRFGNKTAINNDDDEQLIILILQ